MEQVLWCFSHDLKVTLFDFSSGEIIKSWTISTIPLSKASQKSPLIYTTGIYADWFVIQPYENRVAYFWHHSLLAGKQKISNHLLQDTISKSKV